ncbi:MAG: hypothetical protein H7319_03170 [Spirosoma sp.]|nr:hypothetical protein [Spirosoma sp.]
MKTRTPQQLMIGLMLIVFSAACSRPVAYFQKSQRESFATKTTPTPVVATPIIEAEAPVVQSTQVVTPVAETQAAQVAQATFTIDQVDALVRNDNKLASNKSVQKRLNRVRTLLASSAQSSELTNEATATAAPRKMNLMKRVMLKQLDKKIKHHLAPEKPMAKSLLTIGVIVGIIGLLLLILEVAPPLGLIAVVVGLALVLVDLLR